MWVKRSRITLSVSVPVHAKGRAKEEIVSIVSIISIRSFTDEPSPRTTIFCVPRIGLSDKHNVLSTLTSISRLCIHWSTSQYNCQLWPPPSLTRSLSLSGLMFPFLSRWRCLFLHNCSLIFFSIAPHPRLLFIPPSSPPHPRRNENHSNPRRCKGFPARICLCAAPATMFGRALFLLFACSFRICDIFAAFIADTQSPLWPTASIWRCEWMCGQALLIPELHGKEVESETRTQMNCTRLQMFPCVFLGFSPIDSQ